MRDPVSHCTLNPNDYHPFMTLRSLLPPSLPAASDGLKHLEEIKFNKCIYIEDTCLERLSSIQNLQETLYMMELVSCGNVTDKGIIALHRLRLVTVPPVAEWEGTTIELLRLFGTGTWSICSSATCRASPTSRRRWRGCRRRCRSWTSRWTWTEWNQTAAAV